jgi:hypothetical protein
MTWKIVVYFDCGQNAPALIHKVRNFGEDLWRACTDDGWGSIALEDVDSATDQFVVSVRSSRRVRRMVGVANNLLERHFMEIHARVSLLRVTA